MNRKLSSRRQIENEMVFRRANEKVQRTLERDLAEETSHLQIHFYCECSDETCQQRIALPPEIYKRLHQDRNCFTILPGHEQLTVEKLVNHQPDYYVVKKFMLPPTSLRSFRKPESPISPC